MPSSELTPPVEPIDVQVKLRKRFAYIRQGTSTFTGRSYQSGWTVGFTGARAESFMSLAAAKARAVECGASGKWNREEFADGRRMSIEYTDAKETP